MSNMMAIAPHQCSRERILAISSFLPNGTGNGSTPNTDNGKPHAFVARKPMIGIRTSNAYIAQWLTCAASRITAGVPAGSGGGGLRVGVHTRVHNTPTRHTPPH